MYNMHMYMCMYRHALINAYFLACEAFVSRLVTTRQRAITDLQPSQTALSRREEQEDAQCQGEVHAGVSQ